MAVGRRICSECRQPCERRRVKCLPCRLGAKHPLYHRLRQQLQDNSERCVSVETAVELGLASESEPTTKIRQLAPAESGDFIVGNYFGAIPY